MNEIDKIINKTPYLYNKTIEETKILKEKNQNISKSINHRLQ